MSKGEVEYILRADDSQVERDIENANKKVEKAVEKSADKTVQIEKEKTQDIKKEVKKVEDANEETSDEVKSFWQKTAEKIKSVFQKTSDDTEKETEDTGKVFENVSGLIKESLSDAATGAIPLLGQIEALTAGLSGAQTLALGIGAAFVGVGIAAVGITTDMDSAMNDFISSTGKGVEETERYQGVLENIYANNYGEDFQDIADAMENVTKSLGDMDDSALQEVTESAFVLRDTFEYDIEESTRAAKALMDQFGISGNEAMNYIAAGARNGLDYSDELIDTISEYSVHFAKVGLDADDMFNILQKGADSGAFKLDTVGDAIKEMSILAIDGSDSTKEAFESLGLNADETAEKFAAGGDSAKEAFEETLDALAAMEDPLEQNTVGVALFGTMWEDLGSEAVTALADIEDGAYDTTDAMNQIKEVKYDDLGSMFEALKRNVELLAIPLGEALIPILSMLIEAVLPVLTGLLGPLADLFGALLVPIVSVITMAIQPLIDILNWLITNAIEPLINIVSAVLVPLFSGSLESMFGSASDVIGNILSIFQNLLEFIGNVFTGNWKGAWKNVEAILRGVLSPFQGIIQSVTAIFQNLIGFIRNVFTGNWSSAWQNVKNIFSNAVSGLASIFKAPINAIVDGWNRLVSSLGKVSIPSWVPIAGGKSFSLPKMSRLKVGLDYVPNDMFPAYLDEGEWVLTKEEASVLRSMGGIEGVMSLLADRSNTMNGSVSNVIRESEKESKTIIIHTHVDLDGKEVGNSITEFVDQNMSDKEELRDRGC